LNIANQILSLKISFSFGGREGANSPSPSLKKKLLVSTADARAYACTFEIYVIFLNQSLLTCINKFNTNENL
jgi:hypothetical protein